MMYEEPGVRGAFLDTAGTLKKAAVAAYRRHITRLKELWAAGTGTRVVGDGVEEYRVRGHPEC